MGLDLLMSAKMATRGTQIGKGCEWVREKLAMFIWNLHGICVGSEKADGSQEESIPTARRPIFFGDSHHLGL